MKLRLGILWALLLLLATANGQSNPPLRFVQSIPMPNVEGYFDHPAVDVAGQRLFVPGEYQETLEVIDLRAGKVAHSITGLGAHPRKVVYIPETKQIWVDLGNGQGKGCDSDTYELIKTIQLNPDSPPEAKREPDNGVYDVATGLFYIGDRGDRSKENTKGSVEIADLKAGAYVGAITLDDNDPAGLALDPNSSRLYVVLGQTSRVAVIDRKKRAVVNMWPITGGPLPHALGLDAEHRRLFIGSRVKKGHIFKPGKMVVMDADSGKVIDAINSEGGVDEVQYDPASARVYFTGTTGGVEVFKQVDPDHYQSLGVVPTSPIAKTSLLVPELKRFYVAVPKHIVLTPPVPQDKEASVEDANIMVFDVLP